MAKEDVPSWLDTFTRTYLIRWNKLYVRGNVLKVVVLALCHAIVGVVLHAPPTVLVDYDGCARALGIDPFKFLGLSELAQLYPHTAEFSALFTIHTGSSQLATHGVHYELLPLVNRLGK